MSRCPHRPRCRSAPARLAGLALAVLCFATAAAAGGVRAPDPTARMPQGDRAAEHWDLAAHFTSGHRLYARFLITNQGPGDGTAVALGEVVTPDGQVVSFRNGRREGAWRLGLGGRSLDIGSSELYFDPGERRLVVDNQKRHFELTLSIPDDGSARSAPAAPGGARLDLLNLATPARGRLRLGADHAPIALEGRALLTHTWSSGGEREHALRRIDIATFRDDRNLFLSTWHSAAGRRWQWIALAAHDAALPEGPFAFALHADEPGEARYPIPRRLDVRGNTIAGSITLGGAPVLEVDPLDALPSVLKLMYSFGSPRHVWQDASLDVTVQPGPEAGPATSPGTAGTEGADQRSEAGDRASQAPPPLRIEGPALASIFFLDPVPPKTF